MSLNSPLSFTKPEKCWSCKSPGEELICRKCGTLQPHFSEDYFSYLKLPRQFDIDLQELERSYLALQRKIHPDRFVLKSQQEKDYSKNHSAFLNLAYETLKDPYLRGLYLLKTWMTFKEEQRSEDPTLLAFIFEQRELLQEATSVKAIKDLIDKIEADRLVLLDSLSQLFKDNNFSKASKALERLKYFITFQEEAKIRLRDYERKN